MRIWPFLSPYFASLNHVCGSDSTNLSCHFYDVYILSSCHDNLKFTCIVGSVLCVGLVCDIIHDIQNAKPVIIVDVTNNFVSLLHWDAGPIKSAFNIPLTTFWVTVAFYYFPIVCLNRTPLHRRVSRKGKSRNRTTNSNQRQKLHVILLKKLLRKI